MLCEPRHHQRCRVIRVGASETTHGQTNFSSWSRNIDDQRARIRRPGLCESSGYKLVTLAPWTEQLPNGPERARLRDAADDRESRIIRTEETFVREHQIGTV